MAFNYQKLVELHRISGETQTEFSMAIFANSKKMPVKYFEGRDSISTAHLELMCQHYQVPLDTLITNPNIPKSGNASYNSGTRIGTMNSQGNSRQYFTMASEKAKMLEDQLEAANRQIEYLQQQNRDLTAILRSVTTGTKIG